MGETQTVKGFIRTSPTRGLGVHADTDSFVIHRRRPIGNVENWLPVTVTIEVE